MRPSPRAWELMQESEPICGKDITDAVVFLCILGLAIFFAGYAVAVYHHENQRFECPTMLPDGRDLIARHLGENGDERCTYTAPRPMKKT